MVGSCHKYRERLGEDDIKLSSTEPWVHSARNGSGSVMLFILRVEPSFVRAYSRVLCIKSYKIWRLIAQSDLLHHCDHEVQGKTRVDGARQDAEDGAKLPGQVPGTTEPQAGDEVDGLCSNGVHFRIKYGRREAKGRR